MGWKVCMNEKDRLEWWQRFYNGEFSTFGFFESAADRWLNLHSDLRSDFKKIYGCYPVLWNISKVNPGADTDQKEKRKNDLKAKIEELFRKNPTDPFIEELHESITRKPIIIRKPNRSLNYEIIGQDENIGDINMKFVSLHNENDKNVENNENCVEQK